MSADPPPSRLLARRDVLALLASLAAACSPVARPAAPPPPAAGPPLEIGSLTDLLPLARLRWLVLARPRDIAAVPWLIPPIGQVVPEENLDRFAATSGVDLRQLPEALVAAYGPAAPEPGAPPDSAPPSAAARLPALAEGAGPPPSPSPATSAARAEAVLYLARHHADPVALERLFRARLTTGERRSVDRPDLVRLSGKIGAGSAALALLGPDVLALQRGGSATRGPARIAALYAEGKLKKSPTALAQDPLRALAARLGPAPLVAFAVGPFEGELARGARGLLAGATAVGAAARPSAREGIALAIAVAGDFARSGEPASRELEAAWNDLAAGTFGHLLGLDQPIERPLATHAPDAVALAVELHPDRLARGLAAGTTGRIEEIMRW